jgi:DNA-binding NtrC family response regulator
MKNMVDNTILLIEDDFNLRQSFTLILRRAGYKVTPADCINTAMDLMRCTKYTLVITDLNMAETTRVLIPRIIQGYPTLPLVILTDQSIAEIEKEVNFQDAQYLIKPVAPERLLDCIERYSDKIEPHVQP